MSHSFCKFNQPELTHANVDPVVRDVYCPFSLPLMDVPTTFKRHQSKISGSTGGGGGGGVMIYEQKID